MKGRLRKFVLFVLLGAIVNIAVACGCALWAVGAELYDIYFDIFQPIRIEKADERWLVARGWTTPLDESLTFGDLRAFGYFRVEYFSIPSTRFDPSTRGGGTGSYSAAVARIWCGWPVFSLGAEEWLDPETFERWLHGDPFRLSELYHYVGGIPVVVEVDFGGPIEMERVLPLRPIWPGFAINTVFYAAILWLVTLGPFTVRRIIRRKRGQCIKCCYDLRGHPGGGGACPECGTIAL